MIQLKILLPTSALLILVFSSCGIITKARYGNGFKLNIESGLFAKKDQSSPKISAAKKRSKSPEMPPFKATSSFDFVAVDSIKQNTMNVTLIQSHTTQITQFENPVKLLKKEPKRQFKQFLKPAKTFSTKNDTRILEPNVTLAAVLFYGSIIANALILSGSALVPPIVFAVLGIAYLLGLVFAFIGLRNIRQSAEQYKGKRLAKSIVIVFFAFLLYFIIALAVFALMF